MQAVPSEVWATLERRLDEARVPSPQRADALGRRLREETTEGQMLGEGSGLGFVGWGVSGVG